MDGTHWDFRWLAAPPPVQPGEERVAPEADEQAVKELLAASSPTASAQPGDEKVHRWVGVREGGALIAWAREGSRAASKAGDSAMRRSSAQRAAVSRRSSIASNEK